MFAHVLRRLIVWVPSVLLVMLGVYALAFYGAGDPIKLIFLRAPGDVAYDPVKIEAIRAEAGLDRPFLVQFFSYIGNLLQGNFGNSLTSGRSVWARVSAAAPVSAGRLRYEWAIPVATQDGQRSDRQIGERIICSS